MGVNFQMSPPQFGGKPPPRYQDPMDIAGDNALQSTQQAMSSNATLPPWYRPTFGMPQSAASQAADFQQLTTPSQGALNHIPQAAQPWNDNDNIMQGE